MLSPLTLADEPGAGRGFDSGRGLPDRLRRVANSLQRDGLTVSADLMRAAATEIIGLKRSVRGLRDRLRNSDTPAPNPDPALAGEEEL